MDILKEKRKEVSKMTYWYVRVSSRDQNEERQIIAMHEFGIEDKQIYLDKQSGNSNYFKQPHPQIRMGLPPLSSSGKLLG